ncbi:MAG: dTDP-4-dehydrorhamnose 3,5-epimerase family protein [Patescibacteria group bacterium]|nr:dTDP-4-dehydrorhamnose 3,5-epimerase family protein [Patescibacteria group bacterium]MDD5294962.1 dTDP-4-dehydrorhamnose 3,5-epimerase family protein [Patescibacteria group bacterium]MDD5554591.1 dTDP-4-dehydrorhamnose 3,5-epimerase family protein [Patescibacteria group bacterium]
MIEGVVIKKLKKYEDERGWLTEIFRQDEDGFSPIMSYVSLTKPGIIRGPHEHVKQSDRFVFVGPGDFELYLWDRRENSKTKDENMKIEAGTSNPALVIVPPGVVHGYKCVSREGGMSINLPDKLYKGENKKEEVDEIRWEDREDSPYKIG